MKKKSAFTLAEVLITLTIIGVIAALTIPNLMQKYKKHQVEVGLKEAYSILSNALVISRANNNISWTEMIDASYNNNSTTKDRTDYFVENYLLPYLKISEKCSYPQSSNNICSFVPFTQFVDYNGNVTNAINGGDTRTYELLLANGMYVGVVMGSYGNSNYQVDFQVDIDGKKGANQLGKDVFYFHLLKESTGSGCPSSSSCNDKDIFIAGRSPYSKKNNTVSDCISAPYMCAAIIQRNGWKIPDDYPVKKF